MRTAPYRAVVSVALCGLLAGCADLPELRSPGATVAPAWHAPLPHGGRAADLVSWWTTFRDPALTSLIATAEAENPDLATAAAEIDKARAMLTSARAGLLPGLAGTAALRRSGTGGDAANQRPADTLASSTLDASWEIDLLGKARQRGEAAGLRAEARISDWHGARVSLAAEVADHYVQLRACRALEAAYALELSSLNETRQAMQVAGTSGFRASGDVALAQASAASASATLTAQKAECTLLVKTLARLTGGDEPRVWQILGTGRAHVPLPATLRLSGVPADALRQRPDINALEREVAAARAEFGAAKADLYPSLSLSGTVEISGSTLTKTAVPWSFGPSLSVPLFDGGARRAAVGVAAATHDAAVGAYRSGVLDAVAEIEMALVRIDSARRRDGDAEIAARNYRTYFNTVDSNWKSGGVSLLDREEARRAAHSAEILRIEIRRDWVRAWIALYRALGGGWDAGAAGASARKMDR